MTTFERGLAIVASLLGIFTFLHQYGSSILNIIRPVVRGESNTRTKIVQLTRALASPLTKLLERRFSTGVLFSLGAAFLWSLSYTSYRSDSLLELRAIAKATPIMLVGGLVILFFSGVTALFTESSSDSGPSRSELIRPLFTWKGFLLIVANAMEFLCMLWATHFISAGQMIALYKVNPIWMLLLLLPFTRRSAAKASIAAIVCVLMGAYLILSPDLTQTFSPDKVVGSLLAIAGGLFFAVYSVFTFVYPLRYSTSTASQRLFVQAVVFFIGVAIYVVISVITKTVPQYSKEALIIVSLNGIRVGVVYVLYTEALKRIHPILVASLVALEVPLTIAFEYFWFGEAATTSLISGSFIILVGIISIIKENSLFLQKFEQEHPETINSIKGATQQGAAADAAKRHS